MYRETCGFRPFSMRHGDVHRRVESLELCDEVSVLRRGEVNTLFDVQLYIREDGSEQR